MTFSKDEASSLFCLLGLLLYFSFSIATQKRDEAFSAVVCILNRLVATLMSARGKLWRIFLQTEQEQLLRAPAHFRFTQLTSVSHMCCGQVGVVLDAPFFMLSDVPKDIAVPVMTNLLFAPNLRSIGEEAVRAAAEKTGAGSFNGLHLRVEDDANVFSKKVCMRQFWAW